MQAVLDGSPVWESVGLNSKPAVYFTDDVMQIQNSASGFDGWSEMMIFVVVDYDGDKCRCR